MSLLSTLDADVTVMGKNMLRHLGERREDEEDGKHSDKGEAPYFSAGDIVALVTVTNIYRQSFASGRSHSYSLVQAKVQILCDEALGRIKVSTQFTTSSQIQPMRLQETIIKPSCGILR